MSMLKTISLLAVFAAGCATAPKTVSDRDNLRQSADATLGEMTTRDPDLKNITQDVQAYAVFPSIGKGGAGVGGAYGKGILYERGVATGYVALEQASIGAELGGESFAELLVLRNSDDIAALKDGRYTVGANAGVVMIKAGAEAQATTGKGASVFVMPHGGLMVDVSVSGQRVSYKSFNG